MLDGLPRRSLKKATPVVFGLRQLMAVAATTVFDWTAPASSTTQPISPAWTNYSVTHAAIDSIGARIVGLLPRGLHTWSGRPLVYYHRLDFPDEMVVKIRASPSGRGSPSWTKQPDQAMAALNSFDPSDLRSTTPFMIWLVVEWPALTGLIGRHTP